MSQENCIDIDGIYGLSNPIEQVFRRRRRRRGVSAFPSEISHFVALISTAAYLLPSLPQWKFIMDYGPSGINISFFSLMDGPAKSR